MRSASAAALWLIPEPSTAPGWQVSAVVALGDGSAAKLPAYDDQRVLEHASGFEIFQQAGNRLVHHARLHAVVVVEIVVRIPAAAFLVGNVVEILDQGTQAVAVGNDEHVAPGLQFRRDGGGRGGPLFGGGRRFGPDQDGGADARDGPGLRLGGRDGLEVHLQTVSRR